MNETPKDAARDPAKASVPPVLVKKSKPLDDDEGESSGVMAHPVKQKMLPTGLSRSIVLAALLASLILGAVNLFANRFAILAVPNAANSAIYRVDHLTGALEFCSATSCTDVVVHSPETK